MEEKKCCRFKNLQINRTIVIFIWLFSILFLSSPAGQEKTVKIDELMGIYHRLYQFNGSVLAAENSKVIYKKAFGFANREWDIPNTIDTKHRLGSISKQFTCMLIFQLIQEGKIQLDSKLSQYLPDYRKDTGDQVTILQMMNHTSGIPDYATVNDFMKKHSRDPYTRAEFLKKFCSEPLEFTPGTRHAYSNSAFYLLGEIIEKITGKSYEIVLKEKIFAPLNMTDSGCEHPDTLINKKACGYYVSRKGYINAPYIDMWSAAYSAGAIYSTVEDLFLWDRALHTDQLLAPEYKKKMFTPGLKNYACGWVVIDQYQVGPGLYKKVLTHSGDTVGFQSIIFRLVEDKHLVVLLNNTPRANLPEIVDSITKILYGVPYEIPKEPISLVVWKTIQEKGIEAAIREYYQLKASRPEAYDFSQKQLAMVGKALSKKKNFSQALEIFKLNAEVFPGSDDARVDLAAAYEKTGNKKKEIEHLKKALQINPQNETALKKIKEVEKN